MVRAFSEGQRTREGLDLRGAVQYLPPGLARFAGVVRRVFGVERHAHDVIVTGHTGSFQSSSVGGFQRVETGRKLSNGVALGVECADVVLRVAHGLVLRKKVVGLFILPAPHSYTTRTAQPLPGPISEAISHRIGTVPGAAVTNVSSSWCEPISPSGIPLPDSPLIAVKSSDT